MKLVFNQTGDTLLIDPCKNKIVQTWIDLVTTDSNAFTVTYYHTQVHQYLDQLVAAVQAVNPVIERLRLAPFALQRSIDQSYLNLLHKQWVAIISAQPNLALLCKHQGVDYDVINTLIHHCENHFKHVRLEADVFKTFVPDHKVVEQTLTLDKYQINIHYDNLGRCTYDQWYFDSEPDSERNNFNLVTTRALDIMLEKSYTVTPPREYLEWCQRYSLPALGNILPVGNFRGYENNIADLKNIWLRNLELKQTLSIVKE